jgi:hypothetical protein
MLCSKAGSLSFCSKKNCSKAHFVSLKCEVIQKKCVLDYGGLLKIENDSVRVLAMNSGILFKSAKFFVIKKVKQRKRRIKKEQSMKMSDVDIMIIFSAIFANYQQNNSRFSCKPMPLKVVF